MTGTPGQPVINKFTTNGSPIPFPASVQFLGLTSLAVDSSGNVFVADYGNACIDKFDSNGNLIDNWTFQTFHGGEVGQSGIGVDPSGNIYVITGYAVSYSSGSGVMSSSNVSVVKGTVGGYSSGSRVNSSDNVSVMTGTPGQPVINKFTTNGSPIPFPASVQFLGLTSLAVDSSGNVFVADYGNACIDKFDSNGNLIDNWTFQTFHGGEVGQSGIGVDPSGNIYVITGYAVSYSSGSGVMSSSNVSVVKGTVGGYSSGSRVNSSDNVSVVKGTVVGHSSGSEVKSYDHFSVVKGTPGQGVIEKYTLGNIFYTGMNYQDPRSYDYIKNELNPPNNPQLTKMIYCYEGTGYFDGAFQVFLAWAIPGKPVIPTETNFLSNNSDEGEYNVAFACSAGNRTLVDKIEWGTVKANYVVLAGPALITQEELDGLTAYGVKKVIVFQSARDVLNLLQVTMERDHIYDEDAEIIPVGPALTAGPSMPVDYYTFFYIGQIELTLDPYLSLKPYLDTNNPPLHYDIIPKKSTFFVGGAHRDRPSLFTLTDKVLPININYGYSTPPDVVHSNLCSYMATVYANSQPPFDGPTIPGLKGLK